MIGVPVAVVAAAAATSKPVTSDATTTACNRREWITSHLLEETRAADRAAASRDYGQESLDPFAPIGFDRQDLVRLAEPVQRGGAGIGRATAIDLGAADL